MRWIAILPMLLLTVGSGVRAAEPVLCHNTNFINTQLVPTAAVAKDIYVAILRHLRPDLLKQYPIAVANDEGDHWSLGQTNNDPPPIPGPDEVIVSAGGGQLLLDIDKCTGAISGAGFNR